MQFIYPIFLFLILVETLLEAAISRRNSAALISKGAIDVAPSIFPFMVIAYIFKFGGSIFEYYYFPREITLTWLTVFGILVLLAKALKFWAVSALGSYWTMKVLVVPGSQSVTRGPYRWIRHPNYIAVLTEVVASPLMGKAFVTAIVVTAVISFLLFLRIRAEEGALLHYTDYLEAMAAKRRFIP